MACITSPMYTIKPIFKLDELEIKSPMYTMKNIHGGTSNNKECSSKESMLDQVAAKQDLIFKLIGDIKSLLTVLKKELSDPKIASGSSSSSSTMLLPKPQFSNLGIIHEVVLNTSVKNPPNSLLVLNHLWENVDFLFSWHIHSSVKGLPKALKKFEAIKNSSHDGNPQIRIRVVWKEVSDCELIVSPLNSVPLLGEVNFLRFLNRSLFPEISDHYTSTLFDTKLDACHSLGYSENIQQLQESYNILSEGLDKTKWLVGNALTIVDLACWSAITNLKNPNLNAVLSRWFKDFESLVDKKK